MSPALQCRSVIQKSGPSKHCPLLAKETVLGPASLEERGDRRKPRCALSLAHYLPDCKSRASTIMNAEPLFHVSVQSSSRPDRYPMARR
jgi:hypothetical protein